MSSNICSNCFKIDHLINPIWFHHTLSFYLHSFYFIYSCYTNCILFNMYLLLFVIVNKISIVIRVSIAMFVIECNIHIYIISLSLIYLKSNYLFIHYNHFHIYSILLLQIHHYITLYISINNHNYSLLLLPFGLPIYINSCQCHYIYTQFHQPFN